MGEGGRNRAVQVACPLSWGRSIKYIHRVTTPTSTLCAFYTYSKALRHIILSIHRHRHHQPRHAPPKHNLSTLARPSPSPQTPFFPLPEPSPPASPTHHPHSNTIPCQPNPTRPSLLSNSLRNRPLNRPLPARYRTIRTPSRARRARVVRTNGDVRAAERRDVIPWRLPNPRERWTC